jgi:UDPglucose--hexose-1-phosphate uridylyltransferase
MSEIRFDKLHNKYVIIAPERQHRPNLPKRDALKSSKQMCPFCQGHESFTPPEIYAIRNNEANEQGWSTRVVPNLYKAVQIEEQDSSMQEGFFEFVKGFGAHEVIIDSPCHECGMSELGQDGIEKWLRTMIVRMDDLSKDKRLISLNIFKNSGKNAGATQEHPHTQIIALPMMPQKKLDFLKRNHEYYALHGRGIVEDVVHNEKLAQERVIDEVGSFIAYCPYASFFAFEVIIAPMKVLSSLDKCSREELSDLALLIKKVFDMLKSQLDVYDYNIFFHIAPLNSNFENERYMEDLDKNFTFYLRITPRIYTLGGFEIATEMAINSVPPESCAKLLQGER